MTDFLKDIIKSSGNEYAGVASDGIDGSDWDHAAHGAAEEALEAAGLEQEAL